MSNLQNEIRTVIEGRVDIIPINSNIDNDQIPKGHKALSLNCSIMFVDMRESTKLTDENSKKNMVRVYKSLTRVITFAAEEQGGEVKQIVGDGFLCLFNNNNEKSAQKAFNCSVSINTYIEKILNPEISSFSDPIQVGFGACTGNILLAKVGRKGKGRFAVPIFPSSVTNYASKYCSYADKEEIIIDVTTYRMLNNESKKHFKERIFKINGINHTIYCVEGLRWPKK